MRYNTTLLSRVFSTILCAFLLNITTIAADRPDFRVLLDEAERYARKVQDQSERVRLLHSVALHRARTGQIAEAKVLIRELKPDFDVDSIYESIAPQLVRTSGLDAALEAAQEAGRRSDEASYAIAEELVRQGRLEDANRVMERTKGTQFKYRRLNVIFNLAGLLASQGKTTEVSTLLDQIATAISPDLSAKSGLQTGTVELALSIAAQRRVCGDVAGGDRDFSEIQTVVSALTNEERKQQYLYVIAAAAAEAGDYGLAQRTLESITEPLRRTQASGAIARAQLAAGQLEAAAVTTLTIPGLEERINVLLLLSEAQKESDPVLAKRTLDTAAGYISSGHGDAMAWATARLASIEYQLGNRTRAAELWQRAIDDSKHFTIHPDREQPHLISYVAQLQAEAGEESAALAKARELGDSGYYEVGYTQAASGNTEAALKWIRKQKNPATRANALLGLVTGAVSLREPPKQSELGVTACK